MKKTILILGSALFLLVGSAVMTSCNNGTTETKTEQTTEVYACPMHHDVTGVKGDKCSKCGMDLTSTETSPEHQGHKH